MIINKIASKDELLSELKKHQNNYVLIYKSGSEQSKCAYENLQAVAETKDIHIFSVDVAEVKDVHTYFGVKTAPTLLLFDYDKPLKQLNGCDQPNFYKALFENSLFVADNKDAQKTQKRVIVYSTPTCSWCTRLKNYLNQNNIRYNDVDVSKNAIAAEEMKKKSGQQGVPQTDINGQIVVGFDKQKIDKLLGI